MKAKGNTSIKIDKVSEVPKTVKNAGNNPIRNPAQNKRAYNPPTYSWFFRIVSLIL